MVWPGGGLGRAPEGLPKVCGHPGTKPWLSQRAALRTGPALPRGILKLCSPPLSKQDRLNSKKQKAKDDKKPVKALSRERISLEEPTPESTTPSQEPIDPLVIKKYTQRLHTEVKAQPGTQPSARSHLPCAPPSTTSTMEAEMPL